MKGIVEKQVWKEEEETEEQQEEKIEKNNLTATENEMDLKKAYKSFMILGILKADIDGYFDQIKLLIKALIEDQLKEIQSTKVIITLWVRWKKPVKSFIRLDTEDLEGAQDIDDKTGNKYIKIEMPFNSLITQSTEGSDTEELMQCMFTHITT